MIFHPDQYENMVPNGNSNRENDDNPHPSCGVHYFQTKPYIDVLGNPIIWDLSTYWATTMMFGFLSHGGK
jgi:hypothetical protein